MTELGLFSDEGCIENDFYSIEEAKKAIADRYSEDELTIEEVCPYHREHAKFTCEECNNS